MSPYNEDSLKTPSTMLRPGPPTMSVVIPAYNAARFLASALQSVLSQDYSPLEVIVVDDGSTDDTARIVNEFPGIVYLHEENSGGPSRPRNVGIAAATGEFVALFDADDVMLPGKLSRAAHFLRAVPNLGLVFCNFNIMTDAGDVRPGTFLDGYNQFHALPKRCVGDAMFVVRKEDAFRCLFFENYLIPSGAVLPRHVIEHVGAFDEQLPNSNDRDYWWRLTRLYDIGYLAEVGFTHRLHHQAITARGPLLAISRIQAVRKQMRAGLSRDIRRQASRLVARNLCVLGRHCLQNGDRAGARRFFRESLSERASLAALKGFAAALLGFRGPVAARTRS